MRADPLFLDLRIALGNAEPIRTILLDHLAEGAGGNSPASPSQRALLDAGLAQMIQSIYLAAENILLKIAASIDGGAPAKDENWHAALLARMAHEFPGRRPAVLSNSSLNILNELRGFRHVARNTYAHLLDHERLISNAGLAIRLLPLLAADIDALERYMSADSDPTPNQPPD
jgi:hypothetical protein